MGRRLLSMSIAALVAVSAAGATDVASAAKHPRAKSRECTTAAVPVSLARGGPKDQEVVGKLCQPDRRANVLQVLVHGVTYSQAYWDLAGFGEKYSYSSVMNKKGYATFAIDRVGSGRSSHPLGTRLTVESHANAVHDVVQAARDGSLPGGPYDRVVLVGHSYGTVISWVEQTTYHDVDGLVLTGVMHLLGPENMIDLVTHTQPAALDPRLRQSVGMDLNYLTTTPRSRGQLFYSPGLEDTDPAVVAADEATKGTMTLTELATFPRRFVDGTTNRINVPSLVAMGQYDNFFCVGIHLQACDDSERLAGSERPFWSPAAQMEAYVLPGAGHNMNLERNAQEWYARAAQWFDVHFPG